MLKSALASVLCLFVAGFAQAQSVVVKECNVAIKMDDQTMSGLFRILSTNGTLSAETSQTVDGQSVTRIEKEVVMMDEKIRPGMTATNIDPYRNDLSEAELVIYHAMTVGEDPILNMQSGVDLSKVRSVKIYRVGARTKFGSASIVEAKDANGVLLGSFLGGFLVGACK